MEATRKLAPHLNVMNENQKKCELCRKNIPQQEMKPVPKVFVPAAHFLYGCARYAEAGMYFGSWKFFIGPVLANFEVRGTAPVCSACRRIAILSCIAIYLLVIAGITVAFIGE